MVRESRGAPQSRIFCKADWRRARVEAGTLVWLFAFANQVRTVAWMRVKAEAVVKPCEILKPFADSPGFTEELSEAREEQGDQ